MRIYLMAVMLAATLLIQMPPLRAQESETYRQLDLFGTVFERIRSDYVESVDDPDLIEAAINGMLRSLDPHSSYLNRKSFEDMQVQTRGEFGGLGIEVTMENGLVKVVSPIDDTPAARAGLQAGDFITHLEGEPVLGLSLSEAVEKMRGPVDSAINLTISRPGDEQPLEVSIVRAVIRIKSVRSRTEGDIAYVRITSFNEQTESGLRKQVEAMRKKLGDKFRGIILDLRNNPGGLLDQAVAVSDAFLDQGEIVSTRGRHSGDTQRYNSRKGDLAEGKPVIVLINGGSASASEIVAGALQDHHRAIILGTKSFGKGSVQTIIPLQGQGAIRLTTARYYTPSGRSIQAKGIDPDIKVEQAKVEKVGAATTAKQRSEANLRGHLSNPEGERKQGDGAEDAKTEDDDKGEEVSASGARSADSEDFQLTYALDLMRGIAILNGRTQ